MLTIVWGNEFGSNNFDIYNENELHARAIVNHAITDWNAVINSFNYDVDNDADPNNDLNDTFILDIYAGSPGQIPGLGRTENVQSGSDNRPFAADIIMDDDGVGIGWFFDTTPLDDAEFTGIVNEFQASFVDATTNGQNGYFDFYRTIAHEIGHAVGITLGPTLPRWNPLLTDEGSDPQNPLFRIFSFDGPSGLKTSFTGSLGGESLHVYEGHPNDPPGLNVDPDELMNSGRALPVGASQQPTTRRLISDLTA